MAKSKPSKKATGSSRKASKPNVRLTDTTEPISAIVDCTEDIAVLRAKLDAVNQLCKRFEDGLHQTKEAVELRCVDLILGIDEGGQPAAIARTASDQLANMVMNTHIPSIVTGEWQRVLEAMSTDWHSRFGTLFTAAVGQEREAQRQTVPGSSLETNERLVDVVLMTVGTVVDLLNELLIPIRRLRELLIAAVNEKQAVIARVPKVRGLGRPKDDSLPARNKRIRALNTMNNGKSPAELADIANKDPEIQSLGLKKPITKHIVREVLNPSRKTGTK